MAQAQSSGQPPPSPVVYQQGMMQPNTVQPSSSRPIYAAGTQQMPASQHAPLGNNQYPSTYYSQKGQPSYPSQSTLYRQPV
uniref:AT-rich interactive domain-containing protein 1B-like n=1 Tax=Syphacia muris TaxID=451379 RepID=A0A0N5AKA6_9BILA